MLEEEFGCSLRSVGRPLVSGGETVLVQSVRCREGLVERRTAARRVAMAVPTPIGPLPLDQGIGQSAKPVVAAG